MQTFYAEKSSQNAQNEGKLILLNLKGTMLNFSKSLENNRLNNLRQLTDTKWSFSSESRVTHTVITAVSVITRGVWSTPVFMLKTFVYICKNYSIAFTISYNRHIQVYKVAVQYNV